MAVTVNLKKGIDLPVWEWLRFNPVGNTAAGWTTCTAYTQDRYIYLITTTAAPNGFWRYDTYSDSWQTLATPNTALLTVGTMYYDEREGFRCRALSGSSNSVFMPALTGQVLSGSMIRIQEGTGRGQQKNILAVSDPIIQDNGFCTTATAIQITDNTKKWKFNQWAGYQVRLTFDAGASQIRKVLYNDATNLYFSDTNYQAIDSWSNTGYSAVSPFAIPVATAATPTYYTIEASIVTVDSNWTIIPDVTSKITVMSGGIFLVSSAAGAPFFTYQYYSVIEDAWYTKTATATLLNGALGTDASVEGFVEAAGYFDSGSHVTGSGLFSSSANNASIYDPTKSWSVDRYVNYQARIVSGSGSGQRRRIIAMSGSSLQVERNWDTSIDTSSVYYIYGDTDKAFLATGTNSALMQYHREADLWSLSDTFYTGVARQMAAKCNNSSSYEPVGLTTVAKNATAITSLTATPVVGGSGYFVGDTFNLTTGGSNGKGRVSSVGYSASLSASVLAVELYAMGSGYGIGTSATTNILGTGNGLTVNIASVGSAGRITTAINHWFQRNDYVTIQGTTDNTWNTSWQIMGVDSLTGFDITGSAAAAPAASASISNNTFVDCSANWQPNELVGKIIYKSLVGAAGTSEAKRITANTANTASVISNWSANPVNGTSRYVIGDINSFGRDEQYRSPQLNGRGYATGGTSSLLIDSSKNWAFNQWTGSKVKIVAGTGFNNEILIASNNSNSLSFSATQSFAVDSSSKYLIQDTFGVSSTTGSTSIMTDPTKNWTLNQWAGKRCRIISGTGISQEFLITASSANTLGFGAITTGATTDSSYTIYGPAPKASGIEIFWIFGTSISTNKGKYMWSPIGGGSNRMDRYDITTGLWDYGIFIQPISETLNTGTMYAYDDADKIYFTVNATGRVFYLDLTTNRVYPAGLTPYSQGAAVVGNRMEVQSTPDGLNYLVIFRHTGQEVWRTLLYT